MLRIYPWQVFGDSCVALRIKSKSPMCKSKVPIVLSSPALSVLCFILGPHHEVLLANSLLCSEINSGRLGEPYGVPEIEPLLATCKASLLTASTLQSMLSLTGKKPEQISGACSSPDNNGTYTAHRPNITLPFHLFPRVSPSQSFTTIFPLSSLLYKNLLLC